MATAPFPHCCLAHSHRYKRQGGIKKVPATMPDCSLILSLHYFLATIPQVLYLTCWPNEEHFLAPNECHKLPLFVNQHLLEAQSNNTSTWTPTTVCSAQPTCPRMRPQRAEPCLHLSRVAGVVLTYLAATTRKHGVHPLHSSWSQMPVGGRHSSHHELPQLCIPSDLPLPHSWLVLCFKQAHKEVTSSAEWR